MNKRELVEYYKERITEAKHEGRDYTRDVVQLTKIYKEPKKVKKPKVGIA